MYHGYTSRRCKVDTRKSLAVQRRHGISLEQAQAIFNQVYVFDRKSDDPEQYRAIGWYEGGLSSVIYEMRQDRQGEYFHLITAWRATAREEEIYAENY